MPVFDDPIALLPGSPWTYAIVLASITGPAVAPSSLWALYGSLFGSWAGRPSSRTSGRGLVLALGTAAVVGVGVEAARRWWERRLAGRT